MVSDIAMLPMMCHYDRSMSTARARTIIIFSAWAPVGVVREKWAWLKIVNHIGARARQRRVRICI